MKKKETREFWRGVKIAFEGLKIAWREEVNFRIQLAVAVLVIISGYLLSLSLKEWLVILAWIGLVLGGELFNSAIEYLVDLVSPEYHPLAKQAKDVAAASVLVLSLAAAVSGLLIFFPHLI